WHYVLPRGVSSGVWLGTDYSKKFAMESGFDFSVMDENNRRSFGYYIAPRYQVNNQLTFNYTFSRNLSFDNTGFVERIDAVNENGSDMIIFGKRDVNTTVNTLSGAYTFNNKMSLTVRARHYWSNVEYNKHYSLNREGKLEPNSSTDFKHT